MRPCDLFSEEIHLLVDGELGPAERAVVEEHLQGCPRCLTLSMRLEQMSSVLKAWDTDTNAIPAPALRLRNAVLARVSEHSHLRRRESRLVGLMHYATAALVLLALGAAVFAALDGAAPPVVEPSRATSDGGWLLDAQREQGFAFSARETGSALAGVDLTGVDLTGVDLTGVDLTGVHPTGVDLTGADLASDEQGAAPTYGPLSAERDQPDWDRLGKWGLVWRSDDGRDGLVFLAGRASQADAFAKRAGARSTWWPGPHVDEPGGRLVTIGALNFLHERGYLQDWCGTRPSAHRTVVAVPESREPKATDMTASDMLAPMPGIGRELTSLFARGRMGRLDVLPAFAIPNNRMEKSKRVRLVQGELIEAWPLPLETSGQVPSGGLVSGPARVGPRSFMDPVKAEANGHLKLREEHDSYGSLIAIVEGTTEPILLPAGQFVQGGVGDRVLAETVWMPASKARKHYNIRCRIVQNNAGRETVGLPTLAPYVAGPTIRALLADHASPSEVKAAAARIVALYMAKNYDMFLPWSLLDVYGGKEAKRHHESFRRRVDWDLGRGGFLVRDHRGALVGIESVRFEGPAAEELITRLWMGYFTEAWLRHLRVHRGADPALLRDPAEVAAALAPPSDDTAQSLRRIASHEAVFRMRPDFDTKQGWRVSSLEIVAAGLHLHALEVDRRAMLVSAMSGLPPTPARPSNR